MIHVFEKPRVTCLFGLWARVDYLDT